MRELFGGVVVVAELAELMSEDHFSPDGSLLRAWASHKSLTARDVSDEPPGPDATSRSRLFFARSRNTRRLFERGMHGLVDYR